MMMMMNTVHVCASSLTLSSQDTAMRWYRIGVVTDLYYLIRHYYSNFDDHFFNTTYGQ